MNKFGKPFEIDAVTFGDAVDVIQILKGGVVFWDDLFELDPLFYDRKLQENRFRDA